MFRTFRFSIAPCCLTLIPNVYLDTTKAANNKHGLGEVLSQTMDTIDVPFPSVFLSFYPSMSPPSPLPHFSSTLTLSRRDVYEWFGEIGLKLSGPAADKDPAEENGTFRK